MARKRLPEGLIGVTQLHETIAQHLGEPGPDPAARPPVIVGIETDRASSTSSTAAQTTTTSPQPSTSPGSASSPEAVSSKDPSRADADLVIWRDNDRAPVVRKYAEEFGQANGITTAVQVTGGQVPGSGVAVCSSGLGC